MEIKCRFNKGDTVYSAETSYISKIVTCPDCLGEKTWIIIFPSGQIEKIECQTCRRGFEPATGAININEWLPEVKKLTIANIKYYDSDEDKFNYMCEETGIKTGRVYYDKDLFTDFQEAEKAAENKYQELMNNLATNNFKKPKDIERMLSTFGFTRSQATEKAKQFKKWMTISKIIK